MINNHSCFKCINGCFMLTREIFGEHYICTKGNTIMVDDTGIPSFTNNDCVDFQDPTQIIKKEVIDNGNK